MEKMTKIGALHVIALYFVHEGMVKLTGSVKFVKRTWTSFLYLVKNFNCFTANRDTSHAQIGVTSVSCIDIASFHA
jgi:hypothetical protein